MICMNRSQLYGSHWHSWAEALSIIKQSNSCENLSELNSLSLSTSYNYFLSSTPAIYSSVENRLSKLSQYRRGSWINVHSINSIYWKTKDVRKEKLIWKILFRFSYLNFKCCASIKSFEGMLELTGTYLSIINLEISNFSNNNNRSVENQSERFGIIESKQKF